MTHAQKEPTISIRDIKQRIASGDLEAERLMGLILLDGTGVKKNVNEGFRLLRESAERGDSTSECDVGFCFHTGQGTDFNCSEALRHYQLSADHSNPKGHNNLGYCLFNGEGTRADQKQAAMHFKISSDNNCPEGICNYARCLEYGDGVPQDLPQAATLYKKAADLNNSHAMYCYGRCLSNGIGVPKNDQLAVEYFRQAAEKHDEYGQFYYHLMLFKGRGIERDEAAAVTFFQREALAGNPHAQTYYGIALETGRGVPKVDVNKASMQYRMAANNGDPHGQFCLGMLFRDGKGVSKSETEAARLFKQSADNGYGRAMVVFGNCLNDGVGVTKFKPGAVSYYKAAAEKGKAVGQFKYGEFLEEGQFVEKNLSLAAHFFKMSADQHYAEAEFALGRLYEEGKGVKADIDKAASLYKRAADQRLARAEDRYGKCLQKGRGAPKSPVLAIDFFRRSASQKFAPGQYHLGRSFETGLGVPSGPDMSIAINNYKLAAAQNHSQALYHLGLLYKSGVRMNLNAKNADKDAITRASYGKASLRSFGYPYEPLCTFARTIGGSAGSSSGASGDSGCSEDGDRVVLERNPEEAARLFRAAALQIHTKGLYEYAMCLLYGDGIERDVDDAKHQFMLAAEDGHAESMFMLGLIFRDVDKNEASAAKWLRDASKHGHAVAQCELGKLLYMQRGDESDAEVVDCFVKSAASGYADGLFWLGRIIEEGREVTSDVVGTSEISTVVSPSSRLTVEQKAFACFSLAARQPHPFAATKCGLYTLNGLGTDASSSEALEMFERAASLGDSHAYFLIGRCHEFREGVTFEQPAQAPSITPAKSASNVPTIERPPVRTAAKAAANQSQQKNAHSPSPRNPRLAHINPASNANSASSSSLGLRPAASSTQLPPMKDWIKYYEKAAEAKDPSGLFALGLLYARNVITLAPSTSTNTSATNTNANSSSSTKTSSNASASASRSSSSLASKASEANMERAASLFAESAALGSACGKMCYSCCIARGEGGVAKDMDLAFQLASEARDAGIHWTRAGRSMFEFEDSDSFTRLLQQRDASRAASAKKGKDLNLAVNVASAGLGSAESLASLEDAAKKGHQGAMFTLSTCAGDANTPQCEKLLADSAPWLEKAVKANQPDIKKRRPSLKKIQMTKKSITSHHKALIQKPDGKHTYIVV